MKCPFCKFETKSISGLIWHVKRTHNDIRICPVCGIKVRSLFQHAVQKSLAGDRSHYLYCYLFAERRYKEFYKRIKADLLARGLFA